MTNATLEQQLLEKDIALDILKDHLRMAQEQMKKFADRKRTEVEFGEEDWVVLKVRPYRQLTLAKKRNEKRSPKYFGSYRIEERIRPVACKLQLPVEATIHPVFHVSQLKKVTRVYHEVQENYMILFEDYEWVIDPEEAMAFRVNEQTGEYEVLMKWKGLPEHEATWEIVQDFHKQFLDFNLEDKVLEQSASNVRPLIIAVYQRRGKKRIVHNNWLERERLFVGVSVEGIEWDRFLFLICCILFVFWVVCLVVSVWVEPKGSKGSLPTLSYRRGILYSL